MCNVAVQDTAQPRRTGAARTAGEHHRDVARRRAITHTSLMAGPCEVVLAENGREVYERAGHCGHRDATPRHGVARVNTPPRSSRGDAACAPLGGGDHFRRRGRPLDEDQQVRRRLPGPQRALAARAYGRWVRRFDAWSPVAEPVDARELDQERADAQTVAYLRERQAGVNGLATGDHAMRDGGDPREFLLGRPALVLRHDT